jgi:hypothetical protein
LIVGGIANIEEIRFGQEGSATARDHHAAPIAMRCKRSNSGLRSTRLPKQPCLRATEFD